MVQQNRRLNITTDMVAMERLAHILEVTFPTMRYLEASADCTYFYMEFGTAAGNIAGVMRELDQLVKPYIKRYGERGQSYVFNVHKGRELINIIRYNQPDYGYRVQLDINNRVQQLFVVDLLGSGDYWVFNEEFEQMGMMYRPVRRPAIGQYRMDVAMAFSDASYWTTSSRRLRPHLEKIVRSIHLSIQE